MQLARAALIKPRFGHFKRSFNLISGGGAPNRVDDGLGVKYYEAGEETCLFPLRCKDLARECAQKCRMYTVYDIVRLICTSTYMYQIELHITVLDVHLLHYMHLYI